MKASLAERLLANNASGKRLAPPRNGKAYATLLAGGSSNIGGDLLIRFAEYGIKVTYHWEMDKPRHFQNAIPKDVELVLVLRDCIGRNETPNIAAKCKALGIPCLIIERKKASWAPVFESFGLKEGAVVSTPPVKAAKEPKKQKDWYETATVPAAPGLPVEKVVLKVAPEAASAPEPEEPPPPKRIVRAEPAKPARTIEELVRERMEDESKEGRMAEKSGKVIAIKPHRATHTKTDTIIINSGVIHGWKSPPFQRPLRVNEKVRTLSETLKHDGGVIPGVITLGVLGRDTYLLDGQHRVSAFLMTELTEGYADVRTHHFEDMGEMGQEFVNLNSRLVTLRPDDILRGLEESNPPLRLIRQKCPYVGYGQIRRNASTGNTVSMSTLLRTWCGSAPDTPTGTTSSAMHLASQITMEEAELCANVLNVLEKAWGRDPEYNRLWGSLNMCLCFWIYRRMVLDQNQPRNMHTHNKPQRLTKDLFSKAMMSVSADRNYIDWLLGRHLSERDRSPAYNKLKAIIAKRVEAETGTKPKLTQPAWAAH